MNPYIHVQTLHLCNYDLPGNCQRGNVVKQSITLCQLIDLGLSNHTIENREVWQLNLVLYVFKDLCKLCDQKILNPPPPPLPPPFDTSNMRLAKGILAPQQVAVGLLSISLM